MFLSGLTLGTRNGLEFEMSYRWKWNITPFETCSDRDGICLDWKYHYGRYNNGCIVPHCPNHTCHLPKLSDLELHSKSIYHTRSFLPLTLSSVRTMYQRWRRWWWWWLRAWSPAVGGQVSSPPSAMQCNSDFLNVCKLNGPTICDINFLNVGRQKSDHNYDLKS